MSYMQGGGTLECHSIFLNETSVAASIGGAIDILRPPLPFPGDLSISLAVLVRILPHSLPCTCIYTGHKIS